MSADEVSPGGGVFSFGGRRDSVATQDVAHTTCYSEKTGLRLVLTSHSRPFALDAAWVGKRPGLVSLRRPLEDEAQRRAALLPGARDLLIVFVHGTVI